MSNELEAGPVSDELIAKEYAKFCKFMAKQEASANKVKVLKKPEEFGYYFATRKENGERCLVLFIPASDSQVAGVYCHDFDETSVSDYKRYVGPICDPLTWECNVHPGIN
jgi:hypothetical protein